MGRFLYILARDAFKIYFKIFYHWQVRGKENRPAEGRLIIMGNHVSFLDPPVLGCIMRRQVHFMAKEELFRNPVAAWAFNKIGAFPVKRGRPDRGALKKAYQILKEERILGLFPEGTRYKPGEPGEAKPGAVMIPIRTKTPILPVGISYQNHRLRVSIGKKFTLDEYYDRKLSKEDLAEAGEYIMEKIKLERDKLNG